MEDGSPMMRHAAPSPPLSTRNVTLRRRRRRRSSGADSDDALLDAMLGELGIPTSDKKTKTSQGAMIELLTPPRVPLAQHLHHGTNGGDADSILDLTTPTPPSAKRWSAAVAATASSPPAPARRSRQSIVNLLSPDSASSLDDGRSVSMGRMVETETEPRSRRQLLLPDEELKGEDESDDEAVILRALEEIETRMRRARTAATSSILFAAASRRDEIPLSLAQRLDSRFQFQSRDREDYVEEEAEEAQDVAPKKRGCQKKKPAATTAPRPAKEIVVAAVALEKRLAESSVGAAIQAALQGNTYNNKPVPYVLEPAFESDLNVIQWERRGGLRAGTAEDTDTSRYVIALHYPAEAFLDLLVDRGYEALLHAVKWLEDETLGYGAKQTVKWGSSVLIVEGMDRALIARSKKSKGKGKARAASHSAAAAAPFTITFSDLHDLAFRLFMDASFTCDTDATAAYAALLTREIIVAAVKQSSQEESLESVPRIHSFRVLPSTGSTLNPFANTWVRMLQMIPGVSEDKAQSVLDHYPTFQSLLRAYNDPLRRVQDKEELLADKLHANRLETTLSRKIYRVFSAWNQSNVL